MLSLANAFSNQEIIEFDNRLKRLAEVDHISYVAEPKLDGLAVNLICENGFFTRGATRGDGALWLKLKLSKYRLFIIVFEPDLHLS